MRPGAILLVLGAMACNGTPRRTMGATDKARPPDAGPSAVGAAAPAGAGPSGQGAATMSKAEQDQLDENLFLLGSEHPGPRAQGSRWLLAHPDLAHEPLVELVKEGAEHNATYAAVALLGQLGRAEDVPLLAALLEANRGSLSWEAAKALGAHQAPEAEAALLKLVTHSADDVASGAVLGLGLKKTAAARAAIEGALDHPYDGVRYRAVLTLEEMGAKDSFPALRKRLSVEKDADVKTELDRVLHGRPRPE